MNRHDVQYGPRIGIYMGKPICKSIRNQDGTFIFDRIANYAEDGYPLDQLSKGELLTATGLIYKNAG